MLKTPALEGPGACGKGTGWVGAPLCVWAFTTPAALQAASTSGKPVLLQVNYDNGHFTEDKKVAFRNFANMYAFTLWQAGHLDFQPTTQGMK